MTLLAIDAGRDQSAWVVLDGLAIKRFGIDDNRVLCEHILPSVLIGVPHMAIERMEARGMPTANDELRTCEVIGRIMQAWEPKPWTGIYRREVKMAMCGYARARDSNIRQALIDRWGGHDKAVGGRKCPECKGKGWRGRGRPQCEECCGSGWKHPPGELHGIKADLWQALACGLTHIDTQQMREAG